MPSCDILDRNRGIAWIWGKKNKTYSFIVVDGMPTTRAAWVPCYR